MTDWERVLASRARHGGFHGTTAGDEDAYFAVFAGGRFVTGNRVNAILRSLAGTVRRMPKPVTGGAVWKTLGPS